MYSSGGNLSNYLLYAIVPLLLCFWAQYKVQAAFKKYSAVSTRTGVTGAEAARKMLDEHGLQNVDIQKVSGMLTDYYDPTKRILKLSEGVYDSPTIAAVSVACHESGHAYQHAEGYKPLVLRTAIVPMVNIGSQLGPIIFFIGLVLMGFSRMGYDVAVIGLVIFGLTTLFSIVTLPVEFNASERAKAWLGSSGIISQDEGEGVSKVLWAAAMTYVAAAIQSIATLLYYASFLGGGRRRDD